MRRTSLAGPSYSSWFAMPHQKILVEAVGSQPLSNGFAGARIEEQAILTSPIEVKHLDDRACDSIKGSLANALATEPIIFDEVDDRTLISYRVIHEIFFRKRGDHQQGQAGTVTATAKRVCIAGVNAWQRCRGAAACARSRENIGRPNGRV